MLLVPKEEYELMRVYFLHLNPVTVITCMGRGHWTSTRPMQSAQGRPWSPSGGTAEELFPAYRTVEPSNCVCGLPALKSKDMMCEIEAVARMRLVGAGLFLLLIETVEEEHMVKRLRGETEQLPEKPHNPNGEGAKPLPQRFRLAVSSCAVLTGG